MPSEATGHENGEAMASVGVPVERTIAPVPIACGLVQGFHKTVETVTSAGASVGRS